MFALDDVVKKTVHTAIMILSPELGANLAGHERMEEEFPDADMMSAASSAVSTVNSTKVKVIKCADVEKKISALSAENVRLLEDLLDSRKTYHNLLKDLIEEQNLSLNMLRNYNRQMGAMYERSNSIG